MVKESNWVDLCPAGVNPAGRRTGNVFLCSSISSASICVLLIQVPYRLSDFRYGSIPASSH
jgi:hypothetical protein